MRYFILVVLLLIADGAVALEAQKIAEIRAGDESLWAFLHRLPSSFEAQIFYAGALFSCLGMLANYFQKWLRKEIAGSLVTYLFIHNPRATLLSYFTALGVFTGGISAGVFETDQGAFVGWFNVMWVALSNGFMWDAALNRGAKPE